MPLIEYLVKECGYCQVFSLASLKNPKTGMSSIFIHYDQMANKELLLRKVMLIMGHVFNTKIMLNPSNHGMKDSCQNPRFQ